MDNPITFFMSFRFLPCTYVRTTCIIHMLPLQIRDDDVDLLVQFGLTPDDTGDAPGHELVLVADIFELFEDTDEQHL